MYDTIMSTHTTADMDNNYSFTLVPPRANDGWEGEFPGTAKGTCGEVVDADLLGVIYERACFVPVVGIGLCAERSEKGESLERLFEGGSVCDGFWGIGVGWRRGWARGDEGDVWMRIYGTGSVRCESK
jgi:hypothetical protein